MKISDTIRPRKIRLEASSLCQLKCPSCPNASDAAYPAIGKGYLKLDDFSRLLEANRWVKEVELSNYGEIFLNPDLLEILKCAHERGVTVRADTGVNLNSADEQILEGLVKYRVRSMTCSLDGASAETYGRYRVNGRFDQVITHIRIINAFKVKYGSRYPELTWQFIIFGHNEEEIPMARELGMRFDLKLSWDDRFSPVHNLERVRQQTGYASRAEYREVHGMDLAHTICRMLWYQPQINWDGRILGCARNFWGDFGGNVFTDDLLSALNSERMRNARRMLSGRAEARADVPCSTCEIYRDRAKIGRFVKRGSLNQLMRAVYHGLNLNRFAHPFRTGSGR